MKDIATYLQECGEGCATPASTMGIGNPSAPGSDTVGSGDTFDHQKTAKAKRRKKDKIIKDGEERKEPIVQPTTEGLLDADFGMDDSFDEVAFDPLLDEYVKYLIEQPGTEESWNDFYNRFKVLCEELAKTVDHNMSIMKAFRSKDYTIVSFKTQGLINRRYKCSEVIEIRKFVKNPLPYAYEVGWDSNNGIVRRTVGYRANHPAAINLKTWQVCVLPGEIWDWLQEKLPSKYQLK